MQYVGIDVHPTVWRVTVMQEDGSIENDRFEPTSDGLKSLQTRLQSAPSAVAIGQGTGADQLRQDLLQVAERVLVIAPSDIFRSFPELGKKTHNLARMAHRIVHEAKVDQLLHQSVDEIKRLVQVQRTGVEAALENHLGTFEMRARLWTDEGQAWLEEKLPSLPTEVRSTVADHLRHIDSFCRDSRDIQELMQGS
ncbi:MAG TPA: hypothetical protein VGO93_28100 [Candidatus Xenobia bacterium]